MHRRSSNPPLDSDVPSGALTASEVDQEPGPDVEDWLRVAREARDAGLVAEASRLLETAARRFPHSPGALHDLARLSEGNGDWAGAEQHWRGFLALAGHLWWAHAGLANALREQGRMPEAEAVLTAQFVSLAQEPWIFFEYALLAERSQDWAEAVGRWSEASRRFPHLWDGYSGHSRALRQLGDMPAARRVLTEAGERFPSLAQPFHDIARLAEAEQDWAAAEQGWRSFLARDEGEWWAHVGLAHALRRQRRFDEADAVLAGQLERLRDQPALFFEHAGIAEDRGDWGEAANRYREVLGRFPDQPHAALGLAYMLARLGRRDEGDKVLRQAIAAHPRERLLRLAFARNIGEIGPEGAAGFLERMKQAQVDFPDEPDVLGFLADAFADNRLFDQAEACLAAACAQFPGHADLLRRWARVSAQLGRWDEALGALGALEDVRAPDEQTERDWVRMLTAAGREEDAEARLASALERFPGSMMLLVQRLDVLIANGRLEDAASEWRAIGRKFPGGAGGLLFERRTRLLGLGCDPVEVGPGDAGAGGRAATGQRAEDVVMQFESLGGWGLGCEFGLFQRAMGVEPLGLLRWADIDTGGLIDALEAGFAGVGEPDQTALEMAGGALDEYVSEDRRFGMRMHTYVPAGQVPLERMLVQTCRRLSFLKRKLLDDLRRADKIFVYKNGRRVPTDRELERLRLAIRQYGDNTLLCVRFQDAERRHPTVVSAAPGLLIAHMDTMGMSSEGLPMPIPVRAWAGLVSQAHALWKVRV